MWHLMYRFVTADGGVLCLQIVFCLIHTFTRVQKQLPKKQTDRNRYKNITQGSDYPTREFSLRTFVGAYQAMVFSFLLLCIREESLASGVNLYGFCLYLITACLAAYTVFTV